MASTPAARALRRARNAIGSGKKFHSRGKNKDLIQSILNKSSKKRLKGKQPPPVSAAAIVRQEKEGNLTESMGKDLKPGECVGPGSVGFGHFLLDFIDRRGERLDGGGMPNVRTVQHFQNLVDDSVKIWMAKTPGEKQTHVDAHYDAVNSLHWASVLSDACRGAPNVTPELVVKPECLAAPAPGRALNMI